MDKSLEEYKSFIDDLVSVSESAVAKWVIGNGYPDLPENKTKNELLKSLSQQQKEILASIINQAKSSGIHDALAYIDEKMNLGELKIIKNSHELPVDPFGTEMYYDYVTRLEGDKWPEENEL